jgi:hypothetical protein
MDVGGCAVTRRDRSQINEFAMQIPPRGMEVMHCGKAGVKRVETMGIHLKGSALFSDLIPCPTRCDASSITYRFKSVQGVTDGFERQD